MKKKIIEKYLQEHSDVPVTFLKLQNFFSIGPIELKKIITTLSQEGKIIFGSKGIQWIPTNPYHIQMMIKGSIEK
jgi:hypothetical protein